MAEHILYFTAESVPTEAELAEIDTLNALTEKPYHVTVHNGAMEPDYIATGDYAMGSIPGAYSELPVFDPEAAQAPDLEPGEAIVTDGDAIDVATSAGTVSVSSGVASVSLAGTDAVVSDSDTVDVGGVTATLSIAGNALSGVSLPGASAVVSDGDTFDTANGTVTLSVSGGTVTATYAAN